MRRLSHPMRHSQGSESVTSIQIKRAGNELTTYIEKLKSILNIKIN